MKRLLLLWLFPDSLLPLQAAPEHAGGAGAGLIVTPQGRWFRSLKVGAVLGYVREDAALRLGRPALCPLRRGLSPMPVRGRRLSAQNGEPYGKLRL